MKKITLFLFLFLLSYSTKAQFPEGFDNGLPSGWTTFIGENGLGTEYNWVPDGTSNIYMFVRWEAVTSGSVAEDWLVTPQIGITTSNSLLTFDQTDLNAPNYGSILTVRVSTSNSQTTHSEFTIVDSQNEVEITNGSAGVFSRHEVDLSAYEGQSVYIAFVWEQNDGDAIAIDNIDLENQNASAPNPVSNPTPANNATDVYINPSNEGVSWSWEASSSGDPATEFDIYLGDSENSLNLLGTTPNQSVTITGMDYSSLYYWQVVAKNAGGSAQNSPIWSFTTEADPTLSLKNNKIKGFSIFPTIVKSDLFFESQSQIDNISIFDMLGKQVIKINLNIDKSIDVTSLKKGIYLVKVSSKGKIGTYKIIKE